MYRKLKPRVLGTEGILGILVICIFFLLHILSFQLAMGFGAIICLVTAIISLIIIIRTRNLYFAPMFPGQFFGMLLLAMISTLDIKANASFLLPLAGLMGISFIIMIIWSFQRKLKWRTREMLAFDQLCRSLGELFISFYDQYRNGGGNHIIYQLNALKLNIITEG